MIYLKSANFLPEIREISENRGVLKRALQAGGSNWVYIKIRGVGEDWTDGVIRTLDSI